MAQILVRDLDEADVEEIRLLAKAKNRSVQGQLKTMIQEAAELQRRKRRFRDVAERWQALWREEDKTLPDSALLIREDRDSR